MQSRIVIPAITLAWILKETPEEINYQTLTSNTPIKSSEVLPIVLSDDIEKTHKKIKKKKEKSYIDNNGCHTEML